MSELSLELAERLLKSMREDQEDARAQCKTTRIPPACALAIPRLRSTKGAETKFCELFECVLHEDIAAGHIRSRPELERVVDLVCVEIGLDTKKVCEQKEAARHHPCSARGRSAKRKRDYDWCYNIVNVFDDLDDEIGAATRNLLSAGSAVRIGFRFTTLMFALEAIMAEM